MENELILQRFRHGLQYVEKSVGGIKKLNSSELATLNHLVTGDNEEDPWRFESTEVKIPSGHKFQMNIMSNPISRARDILGAGLEMIVNDKVLEAAVFVYSHLVKEHLFETGNRRTAVLATVWLLRLAHKEIDAEKLLDIEVGNLRDEKDLADLRQSIEALF